MGKKPRQSKTLIANGIAGVALLASAGGVDLGLTPETQTELVAGIMVAVNLVLRMMTSEPLDLG